MKYTVLAGRLCVSSMDLDLTNLGKKKKKKNQKEEEEEKTKSTSEAHTIEENFTALPDMLDAQITDQGNLDGDDQIKAQKPFISRAHKPLASA